MICKKNKEEEPLSLLNANLVCLSNVEVTFTWLGKCAGGSRRGRLEFLSKLSRNRLCIRILGYRLQRTEDICLLVSRQVHGKYSPYPRESTVNRGKARHLERAEGDETEPGPLGLAQFSFHSVY